MQVTLRTPGRVVAMILAVLVAMAVLAPVADAGTLTQQEWRQQVVAEISSLIPTGNGDADKKLTEAAKKLTESLNPKYWADASTPSKDGDDIFKKDEEAVKKLREAAKKLREEGPDISAVVVDVMDRLVANSASLAQAAIDDAVAASAKASDIEKAEEKMAKAAEELADGKPDDAVEQYKKAWEEAYDAWKDAVKASSSGSGGGKYSVYTFWFIDLTDPGAAPFSVMGTNEYGTPGYTGAGNEGYLQVHDEWMQLHVSCSDAFTDGTGDKSDPAETSKYRVVNYVIEKYDNGELNKSCNLVGVPNLGSVDLAIVHDGGFGEMDVIFTVTNSGSVDLTDVQFTEVTAGVDVSLCDFGLLIPGDSARCVVGIEYWGGPITTSASIQASHGGGFASASASASFDDTI